jgi:hypothetical protein
MGKFLPGQTGNAGGRPKGAIEVRDLARKHTTDAITRLVEIMHKGKSEQACILAANSLLDRGWGKPTLPIAGDPQMPAVRVIDARATLLDTLASIAAAEEEGGSGGEIEPGSGGGYTH